MENKKKKNLNQKSFYFEDYSDQKINLSDKSVLNINDDRIYLLFFIFFCLISIFAIKIFATSLQDINLEKNNKDYSSYFKSLRNDILDRNGIIIAKNIRVYHAAIKPNLIRDKKNFLLKLKLLYPELNLQKIKKQLNKNKYFYLKKNITKEEQVKLWSLGEKGLLFETTQTRIYPHKNLFSHVVGQIDNDNYGISGLEKSFDQKLKSNKENIVTTLDVNLQFLIREELIKYQEIFKSIGSASILMDVNTGEILSMVSLPDFNLNERKNISDKNFINRATKGVYELGSVFKTFTLAGALNENLIDTDTQFKNLPKKISCAGRPIREYDEKIPPNLTAEEILIRSGNIGSVRIGQKIGSDKMKEFLFNIGVLDQIKFDIEEVGQPLPFKWGKCRLATASFGHGITTTLLQIVKGYSILANGGFRINPTLIKSEKQYEKKK